MFVYLYAKEHHWELCNIFSNMIKAWLNEFSSSRTFRRLFLLAFYTTMILFRTLFTRDIWFDPLGNIMGGWSIYTEEGILTTEAIENFMLFAPFTFFTFMVIEHEII